MQQFEWLAFNIIITFISFTLVGAWYGFGPVLWIRRLSGRRRAEEGTDRRELVRRVRELLPQATENNVLFSMFRDSNTSGGSQFSVTTYSYCPQVFVADGISLWTIPMEYDRKKRQYELGSPIMLSEKSIERVSLSGKRDKSLTYTFWIDTGKRTVPLRMVVEAFCFRKNSFYPFDLYQQAACDKAIQAAENLARRACDMTSEDLENSRLDDMGVGYGMYAACAGLIGFLCTNPDCLPAAFIFFAIALILLGLTLAHGRIPKLSAVVVLVELMAAWWVYDTVL